MSPPRQTPPRLPPVSQARPAQHRRHGLGTALQRDLAEETPVALSFDGSTLAVMMASPADLEDFALGFALAEGIVDHPDGVDRVEIAPLSVDRSDDMAGTGGVDCRIWLRGDARDRLAARRRHMTGPVGCGLCGIDSLAAALPALPDLPAPSRPGATIRGADIDAALTAMRPAQTLHSLTRAAHGAAFIQAGQPVLLREDVGRHNALDKLIGALARGHRDRRDGAVLITSRVSIDLVQKTLRAGIPVLIGLSAPTAHAVRLAERHGLTLVGNAGDRGFDVFTHPGRLDTAGQSDVA